MTILFCAYSRHFIQGNYYPLLTWVTVAAVTLYEMTIRYLQITHKQKLASTAQCGSKETNT